MFLTTYEPRSVLDHAALANRWFSQSQPGTESASWSPAVDISEHSDRFVLVADIPGVAPDRIDISVDRNILTISGERAIALIDKEASAANGSADSAETDTAQAHRRERQSGAFSRQFKLPESVDIEAVSARGEHGVLVVDIPKAAAVQTRKINVQS